MALLSLSGCATYEAEPLDLRAHRAQMSERLAGIGESDARLRAADTPARLSLADGVTAAEAEVIALFYNPSLRLRRLEADAARASLETAGLWEDPVFGFDGAEILSPAAPFDLGVTVGLTLPVSGRLEREREFATARHAASLRAVVNEEWKTRAAVRRGWARWTHALDRLSAARQLASELAAIEQIARALRDAGELSQNEWRLLATSLATAETEIIGLDSEADQSRNSLLYLLGLPPGHALEMTPGVEPLTLHPSRINAERLISSNTALAVRRAEYHAAEESLRLEIQEQYPDLQLGIGYGSEGGDDRLLLGASVLLPLVNANRAGIAEAIAARRLARALAETELERLELDLVQRETRLKQVRAQREQIQRVALPLANDQLADLSRLIDLGEVDTLLLSESFSSLYRLRVSSLDLALEEQLETIALVELLGPDGVGGGTER